MFKKLLLTLSLFSLVFTSALFPFAKSAKAYDAADASWYYQDFFGWYDKVYDNSNRDEIFGERYTAAQVEWINYSLISFLINHIGNKDINWCFINQARATIATGTSLITSLDDIWGALTSCTAAVDDVFALMTPLVQNDPFNFHYANSVQNQKWYSVFTERDMSTIGYFRGIASKFHVVPEARAQGFGFTAANAVQSLWSTVRDFSYFFIVLGALYMAFLVMFRKKLSPQTAVTVQTVLPKLIITLALVTFSYAIAGFMIDLMYVVIGVLSAILTTPGTNLTTFTWTQMFQALTQKSSVLLLLYYWLNWFVAMLGSSFFFLGYGIGNVISVLLLIVVWLILIIVLLLVSFRLWWMLIKTYVSILLKVAFGPIIIIGGLFGYGGGFGGWITGLAADLAVYPVTGFMIFMAFVLLAPGLPDWMPASANAFNINSAAFGSTGGVYWDPPLSIASSAAEIMFLFASLALISMTPKVADIIKSIIAGKPYGYGGAIGEALGPVVAGWGVARSGLRMGTGYGIEEVRRGGDANTALGQRFGATRLGGWLSTSGTTKTVQRTVQTVLDRGAERLKK